MNSIRNKLLRLGLIMTGMVLVLAVSRWYLDLEGGRGMIADFKTERENHLTQLITMIGDSLENLSYDYSYWDDLVQFVRTRDLDWAVENLEEAMKTYGADFIWVLRPNFTLVHFIGPAENTTTLPFPDPARVLAQEFFRHFFIQSPQGLVEIRTAPIQPSADNDRVTPPQGYFVVGRQWDQAVLDELGELARVTVALSATPPSEKLDRNRGEIAFGYPLKGEDDQPVAYLAVSGHSQFIQQSELVGGLYFGTFVGMLLLLIVVYFQAVRRIVMLPLKAISVVLSEKGGPKLAELRKRSDEFGEIARLIDQFFSQQQELVRESKERQKAQEAMRERTAELERLNKVMVGRELKMVELKKKLSEKHGRTE